jgi:hypothetical protein
MPTNFVKGKKNEELWVKAKKIVEKEYKLTEKDGDKFFALVTGVYKKSGGEIANSSESPVLRRRIIIDALFEAKIGNYEVPYGLGSIVTIEKDLSYKRITVGTSWKITDYDGGSGGYVMTPVGKSGKELKGDPWYIGGVKIARWDKDGKVSVQSKTNEEVESIISDSR